ncbi:EAL domain-containing protein [Oxalobacteraceae bacterium R-40]|uniref:EAL domain-containing protein n=1 Tax=Keguizhuia sedimenti TaxID=3064264 RepID=A0ABU1BS48_9BURK|nr:EAL domain-containing protein [Oxalobacteraceae bacterium R-40]
MEARSMYRTPPDFSMKKEIPAAADLQLAHIAYDPVLECMTDGFVALDFQWRFIYVNQHAAHLIGATPALLIGKKFLDCFPEVSNTEFYKAYETAMQERVSMHIEEYFVPWKRWFEKYIYPTSDGIAIFFHDITERRTAEEKLRRSQIRLSETQRLANIGHWEWDPVTEKLICSQELCQIFGLEPIEHVGDLSSFLSNVHPEDRSRINDIRCNALHEKMPWEMEYRIIHQDGSTRYIHERGVVETGTEGKTTRLFGYAQDISSLRLAEQALSESEDLFRSVFEQAAVGITLTRLDGSYAMANHKFAELLGYTPEELCDLDFQSITHPDDLGPDMVQVNRLLNGQSKTYSMEKRYLHKNGSYVWNNLTVSLRRDKSGKPLHFIAVMEDITDKKQAERELIQQQQLTEFIIDSLPLNVFLKDENGRYLMINEEAARTAGISKAGAIGKSDFDIFPEETAKTILEDDRYALASNDHSLREVPIISHGKERIVLAGKRTVHLQNSPAMQLGFSIDITDRKQNELRIQYLATHDALTGLPNRNLLQDRLEHAISMAHRSQHMVAVLFFDIDRFKLINDSFGHKAGDEFLQIMASRLRQVTQSGDTAARLGGDEFVVLLEGISSNEEVVHTAEKILACLHEPLTLNQQELVVSVSIGISVYPNDHQNAETLLKDADIAMYHAKVGGGNNFRFYDSEMNTLAFQRLTTENRLRKALELDQVVLYFQPLVDLKTGQIKGMEVLMRWNDPANGLVGPDQFLSVAEETGLIVGLSNRVLQEACRQCRRWHDKGLTGLQLSVNLSAQQLGPYNLVRTVKEILIETGMPPSSLKLEITESELMDDVDRAKRTLHELSAMGVEIAIDDFGTGYSSLSYLKTLPIDTLKVDRSFVRDLATDEDDAAIVGATIGMAHHMGLKVVAEGVETPSQLDFLTGHQCDLGQGYYFSPPLPADAMESLLQSGRLFPMH